jgi:hypothetical protein
MKRTALAATSLVPPTVTSGLGFATASQYGTWAVAAEFALALGAGSLSFHSFRHKLSAPLSWTTGGAALLLTQAGVTGAAGWDWPSLYAWLLNTSVAFTGALFHKHFTRHDRSKVKMDEVKIETMLIRQKAALLKLERDIANMQPEHVPNLLGRTTEETNIRTAVFELFAVELPGVFVERSRTGWTAVLDLPAALDRTKLRAQWEKVAGALAVEGEFVLTDGPLTSQLVVRYLDGDPLSEVIPFRRPTAESFREPVVLGVDRFGEPVTVELAYNHTLIAGSSKFGKSNLVKKIILSLAALPDTVLYGVDMKPGAPELSLMRPVLHDLAQTVDQARALFLWLQQEMEERGEIMAKAGATAWDPAAHGRPAVFVVVDEVGELTRQGGAELAKTLESLLALARAFGLHLILATQQPSARVFGGATDARGNLAVRISTRMNDKVHRQFVFADNAWDPGKLDMPGKFMMQSPDHTTPQPYKAEFVRDDVAAAEVARLGQELVPAPVGKRLVLPAPEGLSGQQKAMYALKRYGNMTRKELELATGLDDKQVLRALQGLKPEVERCEDTGTWRIALSGAWEAQAVTASV